MGLSVSPNLKWWQSSLLTTPHSPCHSPKPHASIHSPLKNLSDNTDSRTLRNRWVYRSCFGGFENFRTQSANRAYSASAGSDDFLDQEMMKLIQEAAKRFDQPEDDDVSQDTQDRDVKNFTDKASSEKSLTMKPDILEPSQLGIQPEPPNWPERDAMLRMSFARKLSCVGVPLSIRIIRKKLQWDNNFIEASDLTYCSVKKAFSSLLYIIHELQNYALQIMETMYCEDLRDVMNKFRRDLDASFVWLFQKVFWKSPSLMLNMMVLLANFPVCSIGNHTVGSVFPTSSENKNKEGFKEEERLWNSTMQEAWRLQDEVRREDMNKETIKHFVTPESLEIEGDKYEAYARTDLHYKKQLCRDPNNSLLLSNYAQFLYLVVHDHNLAEKYFRKSVAEPADAEALCRYADFLWMVRNDLRAAEVRYLQAIEEDRDSTHYQSKYATFLWSSGAEDTCYPI